MSNMVDQQLSQDHQPVNYQALLQEAYVQLQQMRVRLDEQEEQLRAPIAVVGMACRFPGGANTPEAYWQLLAEGVDAITEVPPTRWDLERYYDPDVDTAGHMYSRHGGFLDGVDHFEPAFFNISPREAVGMDPQQRLLLEVSWEALEHANLAGEQIRGSQTGVFIGKSSADYERLAMPTDDLTTINPYSGLGNANSVVAGRLAYTLGLHGPAITLDAACASSLMTVHLAAQSLRSGESHLALAGGVNLILVPDSTIGFSQLRALAPDGRCKTFDARADGYVRSEGCGILVLKRYCDAVADGDTIFALIRGSAANHDGASNGLTAPNGKAQQAVIRQALANARVDPSAVDYIEAHGTGTALGDPIEVLALHKIWQAPRTKPLYIGSSKTNIGHLEGAAGVASLIKTILTLQHKQIPPHLHFETPNPHISWAQTPFHVPTTLIPWNNPERIAGVSAFGMSGTNVHIVLAAPPEENGPNRHVADKPGEVFQSGGNQSTNQYADRSHQILTLSAKTAAALAALCDRYTQFLAITPAAPLADLCFSANHGRSDFAYRAAFVAETTAQLRTQLAAMARQDLTPMPVPPGQQSKIAFLFTGQGAQSINMGRELYATNLTFRQAIDHCANLLQAHLDEPLLEILYPQADEPDKKLRIHETANTQPALFALEYALATLWQSWGIHPAMVMGHSVGELVAACIAGVFTLEDGLKLIAARSRLMQALPRSGAMVTLMATEAQVQRAIAPHANAVAIAAVNSPTSIVISGQRDVVDVIVKQFADEGIKNRPLTVSHAFHSPLMEPMLEAFRAVAEQITYHKPTLPLISNVTGKLVEDEIWTADYWVQHVRKTVRFADGIATLQAGDIDTLLEIGPKPTLLGMASEIMAANQPSMVNGQSPTTPRYLPSLRPGHADWQQLLTSLRTLYLAGVNVDWQGFERGYQRHNVVLPTYPFQRQRYWIETAASPSNHRRNQEPQLRPLVDRMINAPLQQQTLFETEYSLSTVPILTDHRVMDAIVAPGAYHLAMLLQAADLTSAVHSHLLEGVTFLQPLVIPKERAITAQLICTPSTSDGDATTDFQIISFAADTDPMLLKPATHATGRIKRIGPSTMALSTVTLAAIQQRCPESIAVDAFYDAAAARRLAFGPSFQWLAALWRGEQEALGKLRLPESFHRSDTTGYQIHPGLLDACFQVAGVTLDQASDTQLLLPFAVDTLRLHQAVDANATEWWCHAMQVEEHRWNLQLLDAAGNCLVEIVGFVMRAVALDELQQQAPWYDWLYRVDWHSTPRFGLSPTYFPPAPLLRERGQTALTEQLNDATLANYQQLQTELERVSLDYLLATFVQAGVTFTVGSQWTVETIAEQLQVVPAQHRLLARLLNILTTASLLRQGATGWEVTATPTQRDPQSATAALQSQFGDWAEAELTLLARCGQQLGAVLRGQQAPLELLYPGGDLRTVAMLNQQSYAAKIMNHAAQEVILQAIAQLPAGRGLRILEIGAGTGGTTAAILPHLPAQQTEYFFTDAGALFIAKAQETFADYSFVAYQTLDIERSPREQGFPAHQMDIVLAANVLHSTQDLPVALQHIQQLLTPGGLLILLERTTPSYWFDLTVGLTAQWQHDPDTRTHDLLLTNDAWQLLLQEYGFQQVTAVPSRQQDQDEEEMVADLGQTLVIAQAGQEPTQSANLWLLFADNTGVAKALAAQLRQRGEASLLVCTGDSYQQLNSQTVQIDPDDAEHYRRLVADYPQVTGIVHLWSLDEPTMGVSTDLLTAAHQGCGTALHLVHALLQRDIRVNGSEHVGGQNASRAPHLWFVTRNAQTVDEHTNNQHEIMQGFAQSGLWGMGKVIALEHPELQPTCVDLDEHDTVEVQAATLGAELTTAETVMVSHAASRHEAQVALRGTTRYVARLTRHQSPTPLPDGPYQLTVSERGTLENLELAPIMRTPPVAGQVEVRVHATGLNFRDVLNALGLYPGDAGPLGGECAGEIVAVGPEVGEMAVGDAVVVLAAGAFRQYVTVDAHQVAPIPPTVTYAEAATIPIAFLTAWYTLHHLAQIGPSDRVLIHAAAGGVGQAAIQLAQQAGAEIYCTASPGKWATLQSLGVTHIYHSRTLDFADAVLADTNGAGVTIVLNSLTGPGFIEKSLSTLAPAGHFIEIGKRDIWSHGQFAAVRPDVSYHLFDLATVSAEEPAFIQTALTSLMAQFAARLLHPLPQTTFGIQDARGAFRFMQQAKHTGKIVLTHSASHSFTIHPAATYLITGGLGGLGLRTARWLAEQGADHLVLMGRRAPNTGVQSQLAELEAMGVQLTIAQADVTDQAALAEVLAAIPKATPLRGIIHAAGVLDDGALSQLDWERFVKVLSPKLQGAWNLHILTQGKDLDFFVLFSSVVGLLGNQGQANHAAANAFLDAFAHYRQAQGLPALSINWGAWSEIGAAAELVRTEPQRFAAVGQDVITPEQGIQSLAYLLMQESAQTAVMPIDWPRFLALWEQVPSFFTEFATLATGGQQRWQPSTDHVRQQLLATPPAQRPAQLIDYLRRVTANVLALPSPDAIDPAQGLMELGLDSLMAIELKNLISRELALNIPVAAFIDASLAEIAQQLGEQLTAAEHTRTNDHANGESPISDHGHIASEGTSTINTETGVDVDVDIDDTHTAAEETPGKIKEIVL